MTWWSVFGRFRRGARYMMHNGPGSPLEPATLVRREKKPHALDPNGVETWWVRYDSDPSELRLRGIPCVCRRCFKNGW